MSDPQIERTDKSDLAPFEGTRRRCGACAWPVMSSKFVPALRIQVDGEGNSTEVDGAHLLRMCEQCGFEIKEQLAPAGVNEMGVEITGG